jgi:hypothetical protein
MNLAISGSGECGLRAVFFRQGDNPSFQHPQRDSFAQSILIKVAACDAEVARKHVGWEVDVISKERSQSSVYS